MPHRALVVLSAGVSGGKTAADEVDSVGVIINGSDGYAETGGGLVGSYHGRDGVLIGEDDSVIGIEISACAGSVEVVVLVPLAVGNVDERGDAVVVRRSYKDTGAGRVDICRISSVECLSKGNVSAVLRDAFEP